MIKLKDPNLTDASSLRTDQKFLVNLVDKLSGQGLDDIALRKAIERAATPKDLENVLKTLKLTATNSANYVNELKKEINTISDTLASDSSGKGFTNFIKELSKERESSNKNNDVKIDSDALLKFIKKNDSKKSATQNVTVENKKDIDISLDYLQNEADDDSKGLAATISKYYTIESNQLVETDNHDVTDLLMEINKGNFIDALIKEQQDLELIAVKEQKHVATLAESAKNGDEADVKAYILATETQVSINKSLSAVKAVLEKTQTVIETNKGAVKGSVVKKVNNVVATNKSNDLDAEASKGKKAFDILHQGTESFQKSIDAVGTSLDDMSNAFKATGQELSGLEGTGQYIDGFGKLIGALTSGPVAIFGAALGIAALAIKGYSDQLNIAREINGGQSMVADLQKMHIKTLMDPAQLKKLSDDLSSNFNSTFGGNKKDLEKIAVKQRLTDRVMGKEYSEMQIESVNALLTSFESTSVTGMMDELQASTNALAKTMGVSNKFALEQIKAIHENTKEMTKKMDKGMKKSIEKEFASMEAGLRAIGLGTDEITELREQSVNQLSTREGAQQLTLQTLTMRSDPAMMKALDEMAKATGAGSADKILTAMNSLNAAGGDSKKAAILLAAEMKISQTEAAAYLVKASTASNAAINKVATKAQKDGDITRVTLIEQTGAQLNGYIGESLQAADASKKISDGIKQHKERDKGESATADLNKILVAMGATTVETKAGKINELYLSASKEQKAQMDEFMKAAIANGSSKEMAKEDALKYVMADQIKAQAGKDKITLGNKTIDMTAVNKMDATKLTEKTENLSAVGLEITTDNAERLGVTAKYAIQNEVMGLVNASLGVFNDLLNFATNNFKVLALVAAGLAVLMAVKGPLGSGLGLFGKGLLGASNSTAKASTNLTGGLAKASTFMFSGIKDGIKKFSLSGITDKISGVLGGLVTNVKKGIGAIGSLNFSKIWENTKNGFNNILTSVGNAFSGFKDKLSNFKTNFKTNLAEKKAAGGGMFTSFERDESGKIKTGVDGKGIKKTGGMFGKLAGGIKGLAGPAILATAGMIALEGAMDGWGKANEWFTGSLESTGNAMKQNTADSELLAKSINSNAKWNEKTKQWEDEKGNIIKSQGDLLTENSSAGLELAKSLSKTGKAIWNGTKYVDELGRTIEPSATLAQKSASAVGGALEALSFGLLDGQSMANKTAEIFSWFGKKMDKAGITAGFSEIGSTLATIGKAIWDTSIMFYKFLSPVFDALVTVFGGIVKYISGFFKIISGIFTGDLSKIGEGIKTIFSGFYDIITAPFKMIVGFIDKIFGTDLMSAFDGLISSVNKVFGGIVDLVLAPFKAIKAYFTDPSVGLLAAFTMAFKGIISAVGSIFGGLTDIIKKPIIAAIDWVKSFVPFSKSSSEEKKTDVEKIQQVASRGDKKKGDALAKKFGIDSIWGHNKKELEDIVSKNKLGVQDIKNLIASDETSSGEKDELAKILKVKEKAAVPVVKSSTVPGAKSGTVPGAKPGTVPGAKPGTVPGAKLGTPLQQPTQIATTIKPASTVMKEQTVAKTNTPPLTLNGILSQLTTVLSQLVTAMNDSASPFIVKPRVAPALADGGSTGGLGDVFAQMIMPDTSKEKPVATVGTDEYVVSKDMIKSYIAANNTDKLPQKGLKKTTTNNHSSLLGDISESKSNSVGTLNKLVDFKIKKGLFSKPLEVVNDPIPVVNDPIPVDSKTLPANIKIETVGFTDSLSKVFDSKNLLTETLSKLGTTFKDNVVTPISNFSAKIGSKFGKLVSTFKETTVFKKGKEAVSSVMNFGKDFLSNISGFIHKAETGKAAGDYAAAKDIGDGAGISFGSYQLTEKSGGIKAFLNEMSKSGDAKATELAKQFNKGGTAFGGNKSELTAYLKSTGASDKGKKIQDKLYSEKYLKPALELAKSKGITDKAAIAQIVDHSVNAGVGGAKRMLNNTNGTSAEDVANARKKDYRSLKNYGKYGKGWESRVDNNLTTFKQFQGQSVTSKDLETKVASTPPSGKNLMVATQQPQKIQPKQQNGIDNKQASSIVTSLETLSDKSKDKKTVATTSTGKNIIGGVFANGGEIPPKKISVVGEQGPELIAPMESLAALNKNAWTKFGEAAGFSQGSGFDFVGPNTKASSTNIPSVSGTSGLNSMAGNISSGYMKQTTNNIVEKTTSETKNMGSKINRPENTLERLVMELIEINKQQLGHLGLNAKEAVKANMIGQKQYKTSIDRADVLRQKEIALVKSAGV